MQHQQVLPVLDIRHLWAGGVLKARFLKELAEAARTVGFFYISGHGLNHQQQEILSLSRDFFALPEHQKRQVEMVKSPHFRGYTRMLNEVTQGKADQREQFDIMQENAAPPRAVNDPQWWQLIGPNQWPEALPKLKPRLLEYQYSLTKLGKALLSAFSEVMEQPADIFENNIEHPYTHMKLIRYPGVAGNERQGVGSHKDPGYLTIVSPDDQSGLEVYKDNIGWVSVPPLQGAFVVNIGELLELASDGYLRATEHRVVSPSIDKVRYSIAFFLAAQLDSNVPLFNLPENLKSKALGPSSDPQNPLFYQVGENVLKGRLRSHPDVAAAHYLQKAC